MSWAAKMADVAAAQRLLGHAVPFAQASGARLLAQLCRRHAPTPETWAVIWDGLTRGNLVVSDTCASLTIKFSPDPVAHIRRCLSVIQNLQPRYGSAMAACRWTVLENFVQTPPLDLNM